TSSVSFKVTSQDSSSCCSVTIRQRMRTFTATSPHSQGAPGLTADDGVLRQLEVALEGDHRGRGVGAEYTVPGAIGLHGAEGGESPLRHERLGQGHLLG